MRKSHFITDRRVRARRTAFTNRAHLAVGTTQCKAFQSVCLCTSTLVRSHKDTDHNSFLELCTHMHAYSQSVLH